MKIKTISINGSESIELANMVVIVGPNSSGKTRFLEELHSKITNRKKQTSFWELEYKLSDISEEDKKLWLDNATTRKDKENTYYYCPFTQDGQGNLDGKEFSKSTYEKISSDFQHNTFNEPFFLEDQKNKN